MSDFLSPSLPPCARSLMKSFQEGFTYLLTNLTPPHPYMLLLLVVWWWWWSAGSVDGGCEVQELLEGDAGSSNRHGGWENWSDNSKTGLGKCSCPHCIREQLSNRCRLGFLGCWICMLRCHFFNSTSSRMSFFTEFIRELWTSRANCDSQDFSANS